MLRRLFARFAAAPAAQAPQASVPPGQRVYAIGDIHGRLDLLETMLGLLEEDNAGREPAETTVIFLGDLIDRGPASAQVVQRLLDLSIDAPFIRFLMGNHEEVFLKAMTGDLAAVKFFHRIGGDTTIMSYGMSEADYTAAPYQELAEFIQRAVPKAHVEFVRTFENQIVIGDYAFVHAGVQPGVPLAEQKPQHLRWIRESFLDHTGSFEKVIVHGHTITDEIEVHPNRIGLDTGAYATGRLTAMGFEGSERWICQTVPAKVDATPAPPRDDTHPHDPDR